MRLSASRVALWICPLARRPSAVCARAWRIAKDAWPAKINTLPKTPQQRAAVLPPTPLCRRHGIAIVFRENRRHGPKSCITLFSPATFRKHFFKYFPFFYRSMLVFFKCYFPTQYDLFVSKKIKIYLVFSWGSHLYTEDHITTLIST